MYKVELCVVLGLKVWTLFRNNNLKGLNDLLTHSTKVSRGLFFHLYPFLSYSVAFLCFLIFT